MDTFIQNIESFGLGQWDWIGLSLCAFAYGISKGGIKGVGSLCVPVMAIIFGGKPSTGIVLPILIMADFMAVPYYNKHADWKQLFKLLPWSFVGVLIGVWVGDSIPASLFQKLMAVLVILAVGGLIWQDRRKNPYVPTAWWFAAVLGMLAGFTTMIGNVAGAIVTLYLFSMQLPKFKFIGTSAWFFMITNLFKIPFHIFVWETISFRTFSLNLVVLPVLIIGFITAVIVVKRLRDENFRYLILFLTTIAALLLFFR